MNKSILLILALVLFCFVDVMAQGSQIIRGRVVDRNGGDPVIGGTVAEIDGEGRILGGTATDINGDFVYNMRNREHMLRVSVIGYQALETSPQFDQPMRIELTSSDVELEGVTVTAQRQRSTGLTNVEERDRASSSVRIELVEMQEVGITSAADALQGRISGLDIISASGDPGAGSQIVIRGLSSVGNSRPLIVIDGIPQQRVSSDFELSSADAEDISNMINVALQDIKSIEVLKDAGATAIYGSSGADGVLLIETRSGQMGKVQFEYQYKYSLNVQPPSIPMLRGDDYVTLQIEQMHNARGNFVLPREIAYDRDYPDFYNYSANTDWLSAITQDGNTHDHYFALSGGGERTRYSASFSWVDEDGTTVNTNSKRFSTRINLDYILSQRLMFSINFNYITNDVSRNVSINNRNIREMAYMKAPNMSIWEYDESGEPTGEYFNPINSYQGSGEDYFNPVAIAELGKNNRKDHSLENTFSLRYTILDWLRYRQTVSFQYRGEKTNVFIPYNALGVDWLSWRVNMAEEANNINSSIRTESQFIFNAPTDVDIHDISGTATWITDNSNSEWMNLQSNRTPSVNLQDPATNAQINWIGSGSGQTRELGAVMSLNYKYLDRYMLQYVARADAFSGFGKNNRWGLFQGISAGWRFSDEPFLAHIDWLGESRIRFSWGTSGRQPGNSYARFALYESSSFYVRNTSVIPTRIQLDNLRWESVETYNTGFNINLFNDRLYIETDFYTKTTTDLLFGGTQEWQQYDIPYSSGFAKMMYLNGGEMHNYGWELMLNGHAIRKRDVTLSFYFNTSHNVNRFTKLPDNFNTERSVAITNGEYPRRVVEGEPIGSFFGFEYLGVFPSDADAIARDSNNEPIRDADGKILPMTYMGTYEFKGGDAIYRDQNNDGRIDLNDVVYIGDSNPKYMGGFGSNFRYKDFDASVGFHYRVGFDIINEVAINTEGMNNRNNQSMAVLNRWRVDGQTDPNILPRAYENHPANNLGSDRYVEKGDFLRLSNLKIGYRLPKSVCEILHVDRMNFALSGRRLYTLTNYSGQDPEVGQDASDPFWIGVDKARTPPSRMYTFSVSVFF